MTENDRRMQVYREGTDLGRRSPSQTPLRSLCQYIELILKVAVPSVVVLVILCVLWTVVNDINTEQRRLTTENQEIVFRCEREYEANKCGSIEKVPPALVQYCNDRKNCVSRHRLYVTRSSIAVRYLGRLVDEFVSALSSRTVFTIIAVIGFFICVYKIVG
jgi:hypothetical protein